MKAFLIALGLTLLLTLPSLAAGNFAFAIPAEDGLTLEVTGYGSDGGEIFHTQTSDRRDDKGTASYFVMVDEDIIFAARPSRWCVSVVKGASPTIPADETLCDEHPSDERGTYRFDIANAVRLAAATADVAIEATDGGSLAHAASGPMTEAIAARCVQRELDDLGYAVGTIDGQIGKKSVEAGAHFAADNFMGDELGVLSGATAELWCNVLAARYSRLSSFLEKAREETALSAATYGTADDFKYDIADNVPPDQVRVIKTALAMAQAYLDSHLGGGLSGAARKRISVKIVATGKGNQEPGGNGGVATAFARSGPRPFFDVANAQWNQDSSGRGWTTEADSMKTVAHEYGHVWQGSLGAISATFQPLGPWMNEGIAEYLGYRVMVDAGEMKWDDVRPFVLQGALQDQLGGPLKTISTRVWSGHVGFLAIDWLVDESPNGLMSLRILAEDIGKGKSVKAAFKDAFGVTLDDFYAQFEAWRPVLVKEGAMAFADRPHFAPAAAMQSARQAS